MRRQEVRTTQRFNRPFPLSLRTAIHIDSIQAFSFLEPKQRDPPVTQLRSAHRLAPIAWAITLMLPTFGNASNFVGFGQNAPPAVVASTPIERIIVKPGLFASDKKGGPSVEQRLAQWSAVAGVQLSFVRELGGGEWLLEFPTAQQRSTVGMMASNLINANLGIKFAHPDIAIQASATPNDPMFAEQWNYHAPAGDNRSGVNAPQAWDLTRGAGVTVAVIDSGYRPHADLVSNILPSGYDFMSRNDNDSTPGRDSDAQDPYGLDPNAPPAFCERPCLRPHPYLPWHGTHVAGIVAAVGNNGLGVTGVAYQSKVLPVRVLGALGGELSDLVDSIRWTAGLQLPGHAPLDYPRAQVINLSLASVFPEACPAALQDAINAAHARNVSIIVAAGNNSAPGSSYFPGNCNNVLPVTAVARSGAITHYSNFIGANGLAAPGGVGIDADGIKSTYNLGGSYPAADSYAFQSGTSMAAPHVAGVAALIKALRPTFTPNAIYQHILATVRPHAHSSCNTANCGAGLLDAGRAIASLGGLQSQPLHPGFSGTWYNPNMSGQGFVFDIDGVARYVYAGWYSFDAGTNTGPSGQRWYSAQAASVQMGAPFVDLLVYRNTGGRFDSLPATQPETIGTARLSFQSCTVATFNYTVTVDNQARSGAIPLVRLVPDPNCASAGPPAASLQYSGINPTLNGAWYNRNTGGQGFQFNFAPTIGNFVFGAWYTYDVNGQPNSGPSGQRWYSIQGNYTSGSRSAYGLPIYESTGGRFDTTAPVAQHRRVGTASLHFQTCQTGSLSYQFDDGRSGTIPLERLLGASGCVE